jgi:hypothetical protein
MRTLLQSGSQPNVREEDPLNRKTAARVAGVTFLFYIVVGISSMAAGFHGTAATLATIAQNASAVVLAMTLFVVTRVQDVRLAALGMIFRVAEGLLGAFVGLTGVELAQPMVVDATLFAVGSTFFCWLLLRGRMVPSGLAWLGLIASVILIIGLPLQLAGIARGTVTILMWMPMLAFEVPAGVWLLAKGVPAPD